MSHNDKIKDSDAFFVVDPITRQIKNMTPTKIVLVQGDHNSERFTFSLPRYIEGHDMAESAKANLHYINASKNVKGMYVMTDLQIDPDDAEKVICSWLISGNVTKEAGALSFMIEFECLEGDVLVYSWHTLPHAGISVGQGIDNAEEIAEMYADVLQQWHDDLFGASAEGVQNIETAKADALESIEAEKENAKTEVEATRGSVLDAIDSKGKETLETIPDDYTALNAKVDEAKAECEKSRVVNTSEGSLISLPDSAEQPFKSMKVFGKTEQFTTSGKNKLPYPYNLSSLVTAGVTFTDNGDGTVTANGTTTAAANLQLSKSVVFESGKTYKFVSGTSQAGTLITYKDNGSTKYNTNSLITWQDTYELVSAGIKYESGLTINETIYPIIVEGSTYDGIWEPYTGGMASPNPDYPQALESVGDSGSVEQVVCGKNLFDISTDTRFTQQEDGSYINNTKIGASETPLELPYGTYTISYDMKSVAGRNARIRIHLKDGTTADMYQASTNEFIHFEHTIVGEIVAWGINYSSSPNQDEVVIKNAQIEVGSVATPYEPPNRQPLTIPTPNGLRGIPVSSGGNYTDENGQQWICDEIDLERGVYVQHIFYGELNKDSYVTLQTVGSDGWKRFGTSSAEFPPCKNISYQTAPTLCTHLKYNPSPISNGAKDNTITAYATGCIYFVMSKFKTAEEVKAWLVDNPMRVAYPLATPIETPLSEEEIEAYKALHTNYPNTTIYNNDGAYTEVGYVADTKNYIDNKFAALEAAILSTGGNV